jgi:hypothetical protein
MRITKISPVLSLLLLCVSGESVRAQDKLLEAIQRTYLQGRSAIYSLHATFRIVMEQRTNSGAASRKFRTCQWWQCGADYKWQGTVQPAAAHSQNPAGRTSRQPAVRRETVIGSVVEGKRTCFDKRFDASASVITAATLEVAKGIDEAGIYDLWSRAGFRVQDRPARTLLEVLNTAEWVKEVKLVKTGPEETARVRCVCPDGLNIDAALSPRHGFLMKRMTVWRGGEKPSAVRMEYETDEFVQPQAGVFFPKHTTYRVYGRGQNDRAPQCVIDSYFDSVIINAPLDPKQLRVAIPAGTPVFDFTNQQTFIMGKDGRPDPETPVQPLQEIRLAPRPPKQPTAVHRPLWVLSGVLATAGLFAVAWMLRERLRFLVPVRKKAS